MDTKKICLATFDNRMSGNVQNVQQRRKHYHESQGKLINRIKSSKIIQKYNDLGIEIEDMSFKKMS